MLLIAFGSVVAMGLPIGTALIGILVGSAAVGVLAGLTEVPSITKIVGMMMEAAPSCRPHSSKTRSRVFNRAVPPGESVSSPSCA